MGRNKNKVIHIFRGEGTLTPPSLTMSAAFEGWFLDWAIEHPYALIIPSNVKHEKNFIPESVIFKSDYTFTDDASIANKYKGLRWMQPVAYQNEYSPQYTMFFEVLENHYDSFVFMSHEKDTELRSAINKRKNWKCFQIDEWKDTALFMKQLMWDQRDHD